MAPNTQTVGFTLIEVLVALGILSFMFSVGLFVGLPEYDRYLINSEKDLLVDALLESRTRSLASSAPFMVRLSPRGYCLQDETNACVTPFHELPSNIVLTDFVESTTTKIVLTMNANTFTEIRIDQYGYVNGQ